MQVPYFLRTAFEGPVFNLFGPLHFFILFIAFGGVYILWRYNPKGARWIILAMQAVEQLTLKSWLNFILKDPLYSLPLHTCSMGTFSVIVTLIKPMKLFNVLVVYYGYFGGVLALIVASPMDYHFPHLTNFTYFLGHTALLWAATYIHRNYKGLFTKKYLKLYLLFHNAFLTTALAVDKTLGANYCYFNRAPVFTEFFGSLPRPLYTLIVYFVYNALPLIIYLLFREDHHEHHL